MASPNVERPPLATGASLESVLAGGRDSAENTARASRLQGTTFSYIDVPIAHRQDVRDRTAAIRDRLARQTADAIATGRDLIAIKDKLDHGVWLGWLAVEFPLTPRTAQKWMAAAELADKYEVTSHLPTETACLLAGPSTPPEIVAEVVSDLEAGKPVSHSALRKQIAAAKSQRNRTPEQEALAANTEMYSTTVTPGKRLVARFEKARGQLDAIGIIDQIEVPPLADDAVADITASIAAAIGALNRLRRRIQASAGREVA